MPIRRNFTPGVGATLLALVCATPAFAHPHVFAEARLDVNVDAGGNVTSLHHVWRFDDLFSSTVLVEFDKNQDLVLDQAELEEVANVVHGSLADFNYFQLVTKGGKDVPMQAPERLVADFVDNQLIILFESEPEAPLLLVGEVAFGVYDPTFYTAIDFVEDSYMTVNNLPADCTSSVVRPDPDEAIAQNQQTLTEAFFNDPTGNDMSQIFATRLELNCSKDS
ncbi:MULTISPECIES: DUF1007 family protein [unclassified Nitratireductor]|uniref:DUF1007 family protein n=1 Tax=unclassified Nitratireductor TaxID=2641084 RepID=UPI0025CE7ED5|nr:DUF1007 family protein [Nitratireductor sp.]